MCSASLAAAVTCRLCGAALHQVADTHCDEFAWADESGSRTGTDADLAHLLPDPYSHLARLAEAMSAAHGHAKRKGVELTWVYWEAAREYSMLKVRLEMKGTFHQHQARDVPPWTGTLQRCCGWPMLLRPSGWDCRRGCGRRAPAPPA